MNQEYIISKAKDLKSSLAKILSNKTLKKQSPLILDKKQELNNFSPMDLTTNQAREFNRQVLFEGTIKTILNITNANNKPERFIKVKQNSLISDLPLKMTVLPVHVTDLSFLKYVDTNLFIGCRIRIIAYEYKAKNNECIYMVNDNACDIRVMTPANTNDPEIIHPEGQNEF